MIGSFKKSLVDILFDLYFGPEEIPTNFHDLDYSDLLFGLCMYTSSGGLAWPQERLQLHVDLSPMPC